MYKRFSFAKTLFFAVLHYNAVFLYLLISKYFYHSNLEYICLHAQVSDFYLKNVNLNSLRYMTLLSEATTKVLYVFFLTKEKYPSLG